MAGFLCSPGPSTFRWLPLSPGTWRCPQAFCSEGFIQNGILPHLDPFLIHPQQHVCISGLMTSAEPCESKHSSMSLEQGRSPESQCRYHPQEGQHRNLSPIQSTTSSHQECPSGPYLCTQDPVDGHASHVFVVFTRIFPATTIPPYCSSFLTWV